MKKMKRMLSILLCCILVVGMMPAAAFAEEGTTGKDTDAVIAYGTEPIQGWNGVSGKGSDYDKLWFSNFYQTTKHDLMYWYVLDSRHTNMGTDGLFVTFYPSMRSFNVPFAKGTNDYTKSQAKELCEKVYQSAYLTDTERQALMSTYKSDAEYFYQRDSEEVHDMRTLAFEKILNGDKIFCLSAEEYEQYGRINQPYYASKWTRSPMDVIVNGDIETGEPVDQINVASIMQQDVLIQTDVEYEFNPSFSCNLDASRVLFTLAPDNQSHVEGLQVPAAYAGGEWKLTLKTDDDFSQGASTENKLLVLGQDDQNVQVKVTHRALQEFAAGYDHVTAAIVDSNGKMLYYGAVNTDTAATETTITIPNGLALGDYELRLYGEKWNDRRVTDEATGTPYVVPFAVRETYTVTYQDGVENEVLFEDQVTRAVAGEATPEFTGTLDRKDYVFVGWNPEVAETVTADAVYVAQWKEDSNNNGQPDENEHYTVMYTDGVENEVVFEDQVTADLSLGAKTPAFQGTPVREGYQFAGWAPAVNDTVTQDMVYVAQWEKGTEPKPIDPTEPTTPTDPGEPSDPGKPVAPTKPEPQNPQTGDTMPLAIWMALLAVSVGGVVGILAYQRKKFKKQ